MHREFTVFYAQTSEQAISLLSTKKVCVILTTDINDNVYRDFHGLYGLPLYIRKKWINLDNIDTLSASEIGYCILNCYISYIHERYADYFSVITPLYNTPRNLFERAYESLKAQTEKDWEWLLIDDSPDKKNTAYIKSFIEKDPRLKYYPFEHCGSIGEVKRNGFSLANGNYLVELDHDDELFPRCLEKVRKVFKENAEIGFVYSDCIEPILNEHNEVIDYRYYGDDWGFGYGRQEPMVFKGKAIKTMIAPPINSRTVRHITSLPNHVRVWRKDIYEKAGKHNPDVFVCDDFELMVRTFLVTKFGHINSVEYCQYYNNNGVSNTQSITKQEIQRLTHFISRSYDKDIHKRFLELGMDDFTWNENGGYSEFYGTDYPDKLRSEKANLDFKI